MNEKKLAHAIGAVIAFRRKQLGLSQEKMAEMVGLGQESLSRMEKGNISPRLERLPKIAEALQCSVADLFRAPEDSIQQKAFAIANMLTELSQGQQESVLRIVEEIVRISKDA